MYVFIVEIIVGTSDFCLHLSSLYFLVTFSFETLFSHDLPTFTTIPFDTHKPSSRICLVAIFLFFHSFFLSTFRVISSRLFSPESYLLFLPVLSVPSLSLHPSDRNFSFVFPGSLFLSVSLSLSVHPMYRSSSFTPRSVFLSSALSLQPSIRLLSFLSNSRHGNRFRPCLHFRLRLSRPLHLHVHPFRKH